MLEKDDNNNNNNNNNNILKNNHGENMLTLSLYLKNRRMS